MKTQFSRLSEYFFSQKSLGWQDIAKKMTWKTLRFYSKNPVCGKFF